jgi:cyclopropane fatty-acyl-phospholipid synthase-like methyltransferase
VIKRLLFRLRYRLGKSPWDTGVTLPEVIEAFEAGDIPPGTVLDLGCGTGTNAIYMANQGRRVIGLDFAKEAINKAWDKAQQAGVTERVQFRVADVSRLDELELPQCGFALDLGCFHGLKPDGQSHYVEGLAKTLVPGGRTMLYTHDPHKERGLSFGIEPDAVKAIFSPWFTVTRMERGEDRSHGSTWFWMERT